MTSTTVQKKKYRVSFPLKIGQFKSTIASIAELTGAKLDESRFEVLLNHPTGQSEFKEFTYSDLAMVLSFDDPVTAKLVLPSAEGSDPDAAQIIIDFVAFLAGDDTGEGRLSVRVKCDPERIDFVFIGIEEGLKSSPLTEPASPVSH